MLQLTEEEVLSNHQYNSHINPSVWNLPTCASGSADHRTYGLFYQSQTSNIRGGVDTGSQYITIYHRLYKVSAGDIRSGGSFQDDNNTSTIPRLGIFVNYPCETYLDLGSSFYIYHRDSTETKRIDGWGCLCGASEPVQSGDIGHGLFMTVAATRKDTTIGHTYIGSRNNLHHLYVADNIDCDYGGDWNGFSNTHNNPRSIGLFLHDTNRYVRAIIGSIALSSPNEYN